MSYADEEEIQFMREQLGDRISGNETREEIITLFWAETKMTFQSGKRFEVMPIFRDIVRDSCLASIYTDHVPSVVDRVHMAHFYWDEFDIFHLQGELYTLRILMHNSIPAAFMMFYNFGVLSDVNDRLYYFNKISPIVKAHSIQIIGQGIEGYNIKIDMEDLGEEWKEHTERTEFWISQMNKVAEIERFYQVHFELPGKATEEEYISIDILSASIHRGSCRTLSGIPKEALEEGDEAEIVDETVLVFDKEVSVGCPDCLMDVNLFGYVFKPVEEYIIPCELHWHEDKQCFETADGGIPTGVDFVRVDLHKDVMI